MASTVLSVHCNSVTGWDCTYFLLAWLSRSHELQHYTHPSPATNMLREWQKKMETDRGRGGRRQKAWGPLSFFSQLCCFNSSRLSPERKAGQKVGCAGKVRISLGGDVQQQLRPGLSPALAQPPLRIVLHTHANIFIVDTKPSLYQGPFVFQCLEQSIEIRNMPILPDWVLLAVYITTVICAYACYVYVGACLFPSKCACVHSAFCPCRGTILRPSRSWGQRLWVSVSLLSSTEGLSDWWTDGSLAGMKVAVGTEGWATSWEESYMHASIMLTNTPHRVKTMEGLRVEHRGRLRRVERCTMGLLALERFHAPISNETHRPRHTYTRTRHTLTTGHCLCPATRIRWKKHGTWWATEEQR